MPAIEASDGHGYVAKREEDYLEERYEETGDLTLVAKTAAENAVTYQAEFVDHKTLMAFGYTLSPEGRWMNSGKTLEQLVDLSEVGGDRIFRVMEAEQRMITDDTVEQAVVISEDLGYGRSYIYLYTDQGDGVQALAIEYQGTTGELQRLQRILAQRSLSTGEDQIDTTDFSKPLFYERQLGITDIFAAIEQSYESEASKLAATPYLERIKHDVDRFPQVIQAQQEQVAALVVEFERQILANETVQQGLAAFVRGNIVRFEQPSFPQNEQEHVGGGVVDYPVSSQEADVFRVSTSDIGTSRVVGVEKGYYQQTQKYHEQRKKVRREESTTAKTGAVRKSVPLVAEANAVGRTPEKDIQAQPAIRPISAGLVDFPVVPSSEQQPVLLHQLVSGNTSVRDILPRRLRVRWLTLQRSLRESLGIRQAQSVLTEEPPPLVTVKVHDGRKSEVYREAASRMRIAGEHTHDTFMAVSAGTPSTEVLQELPVFAVGALVIASEIELTPAPPERKQTEKQISPPIRRMFRNVHEYVNEAKERVAGLWEGLKTRMQDHLRIPIKQVMRNIREDQPRMEPQSVIPATAVGEQMQKGVAAVLPEHVDEHQWLQIALLEPAIKELSAISTVLAKTETVMSAELDSLQKDHANFQQITLIKEWFVVGKFYQVWLFWNLLRQFDRIVTAKRSTAEVHGASKVLKLLPDGDLAELEPNGEGRPWLLLAIIWYLNMKREQGKGSTLQHKPAGIKAKATLPSSGIIALFPIVSAA